MRRIVFPEWREVLTPGVFPRPLGLVWGEANQRAELILVLGFPPRAICAEIPKQLSRGDQLINGAPAGLPFEQASKLSKSTGGDGRGFGPEPGPPERNLAA
jgi:hypothetical protein